MGKPRALLPPYSLKSMKSWPRVQAGHRFASEDNQKLLQNQYFPFSSESKMPGMYLLFCATAFVSIDSGILYATVP